MPAHRPPEAPFLRPLEDCLTRAQQVEPFPGRRAAGADLRLTRGRHRVLSPVRGAPEARPVGGLPGLCQDAAARPGADRRLHGQHPLSQPDPSGWILSLSGWRDEKALVRWRTHARHHAVQVKGRFEVLLDYHLRVGQITGDTHLPLGQELREQRLDKTEAGKGTTVTLVDARRPAEWVKEAGADQVAGWLGLAPAAPGLVGWEVFDAVLTPGDVILVLSWRDEAAAHAFEQLRHRRRAPRPPGPGGTRLRDVRPARGAAVLPARAAALRRRPGYRPARAGVARSLLPRTPGGENGVGACCFTTKARRARRPAPAPTKAVVGCAVWLRALHVLRAFVVNRHPPTPKRRPAERRWRPRRIARPPPAR